MGLWITVLLQHGGIENGRCDDVSIVETVTKRFRYYLDNGIISDRFRLFYNVRKLPVD